MPRRHSVTIKEIASITGVSTQTVSRVINHRPDVSPETRAAVEAAIALHGFQPSALARSLVQRRSRMIGVIAAGLRYFGVAQTLNGMAEECEATGYSIILKELASFDVPDIVPVLGVLHAHRVEGIIFAPPQIGTNIRHVQDHLPPNSPPMVFLKAQASREFTTIGIDNEAAARTATRHLIALGRHRVAHLAGPLEWSELRERRAGWRAALLEAGLEPGPMAVGDWSSASGVPAFEEIIDADPTVDGLFAANDQMALGALHVANERGIRIPDELAVVGFDDLPEASQFTPSLTTINQPLRELGRLAVRELVRALDEETTPHSARQIMLPTEFIPRASAPAFPQATRPGQPESAAAEPAARR